MELFFFFFFAFKFDRIVYVNAIVLLLRITGFDSMGMIRWNGNYNAKPISIMFVVESDLIDLDLNVFIINLIDKTTSRCIGLLGCSKGLFGKPENCF